MKENYYSSYSYGFTKEKITEYPSNCLFIAYVIRILLSESFTLIQVGIALFIPSVIHKKIRLTDTVIAFFCGTPDIASQLVAIENTGRYMINGSFFAPAIKTIGLNNRGAKTFDTKKVTDKKIFRLNKYERGT